MLDIKRIRDHTEEVRQALAKRMDAIDFRELLDWDEARRRTQAELETLRSRRNEVSGQIPQLKKSGEDVQPLFEEMKRVGSEIKALEAAAAEHEARVETFMARLPNIPDEDVPSGDKDNNQVVATWGDQPTFDFATRDHVELLSSLKMVDYERGTKLGGRGFWIYRGDGSRLEWALLNYFVETHLAAGYEFMLPPHILLPQCGYTAGQFPKFGDDVFYLESTEERERQFLLPTAETALINLHRDEIIDEGSLPLKYFAYTPCYRKEAGSYRTEERGTVRGHQFNKVELFQYTRPEDSAAALDELLDHAKRVVQGLGLHYQVSLLAAKDCSDSMAKTLDIEVWIPSMRQYKEVSSASNARDYQARRGQIRFRRQGTKKPELLHTLNASGLATSRLVPAIVEQFQQADGSVVVPEVLRKWMGKERLSPSAT
ncbi:MAG: serine--tRNA ligase [Myxococcales bacterium]|nr:serine--tRNA ligase [Myxococcales bacterium]MDD9967351.1 serine--tRNA ligase [Myxococcales bacterium]